MLKLVKSDINDESSGRSLGKIRNYYNRVTPLYFYRLFNFNILFFVIFVCQLIFFSLYFSIVQFSQYNIYFIYLAYGSYSTIYIIPKKTQKKSNREIFQIYKYKHNYYKKRKLYVYIQIAQSFDCLWCVFHKILEFVRIRITVSTFRNNMAYQGDSQPHYGVSALSYLYKESAPCQHQALIRLNFQPSRRGTSEL